MEPKMNAQTEWGWNIAAYLFLAGMGAGAYAWGVIADIAGRAEIVTKVGVILGFPALLIGTLFLIADLGVKPRALMSFMNPGTSWIARGSIIISIFMVLAFIHAVTWLWPFEWLAANESYRHILGGVNLIFALLTMVYTGVLLGASRPIALWSTAMLPLLFLVSALSTGAMAIALFLGLLNVVDISALELPALEVQESTIAKIGAVDAIVIALEVLVLIFFVQALHRTADARASRKMMLEGERSTLFWIGVVVVGLVIPLCIGCVEAAWVLELLPKGPTMAAAIVSSLCGILGGLFLRYVVLSCGIRAPLRAGGIEYTFPTLPAQVH